MTMAALPTVALTEGAYCATMFPPMSFPKEMYPVKATRMYIEAAVPFEAKITEVVLQCELSEISFKMLNMF